MKLLCGGVQRIQGVSKASGAPFDMCNLLALVPVEQINNSKVQIVGSGHKQMEMPLDPAVLNEFLPLFGKGPVWIDLATEPRPRNGKFETTVVGILAAAKAA